MNQIIVIGGIHHNTLGVIRALGERGYYVEYVNYELKGGFDYVSKSKYIKRYKSLVGIEELAVYLLKRPFFNGNEVIISCADIVTECLNLHLDKLAERYIIPGVSCQGEILKLMDKITMISMAAKRGINAPAVWELPKDINKVTYPCITKCHISSHGEKSDIVIFKKKEELYSFLMTKPGQLLFAQEYIDKKDEVQFIGCSLNAGENVIIPGMSRIIRSQPNTNTGFLEYGSIDPFYNDIVEKAKLYIKDCGYSGLFSFEIMRGKDDKVWFLEINFRNDGNAWCVTRAGINLPVIWIKACLAEDFSSEIKNPRKIIMMPELQDFKLVLQHKVSLWKWLVDWKRTDYFMEFDKNDKKPFFYAILNKLHLA